MSRRARTIDAADTRFVSDRNADVGGQAVMEGVMMRAAGAWAVAVRRPAAAGQAHGMIAIERFELSQRARPGFLRWPVLRGVVALVASLRVGFEALRISANAQLPEDEADLGGIAWATTLLVAVLFALAAFVAVPIGLTSLIKETLDSSLVFWLVEGVVRTVILLVYIALLARVPDLRRVFEYHGAEHKVIACYEAGAELTPDRAQSYSRFHPRCGTSFLLVVALLAIFVFAPLGLPAWYWLLASRIVGLPIVAGLAFEAIRFAGREQRRSWVKALIWPGVQLQRLTTREPDREQLEVAIAALRAVIPDHDARAGGAHVAAA